MIQSQNLIDKICCKINQGDSTSLETIQTTNALSLLTSNPITVVATYNALPNVLTYTGRMIYVNDENRYYFSTGQYWVKDFTSTDSVYIKQLWAWGANTGGVFGDGTTVTKSSPVSSIGGFTDWCQVSAGFIHTLAVRTNGTAWAWGNNYCGKFGDGTTVSKSSPVSVIGGFTDWCQVSAGNTHSLGVRTNGTAWAWGSAVVGKLGDGTTVNKSSPILVAGGFVDWCQVSANNTHNLGVRTNGTAWAWGNNTCGVLGDGTTVNKSSPILVAGGFIDWCQVSAGNQHSLGVRTNGTAWAWGNNVCGRLGDGTTINKSSPVSVVGGFTDWCQVSAGNTNSFGVRTNGTVWAWGSGANGHLGDGTVVAKSSPVSVVGGFTDWCQVNSGYSHTLALRTNGTAWAWGNNSNGRLGDYTSTSRNSPVSVVGNKIWSQVSGGCNHSIGILNCKKGF